METKRDELNMTNAGSDAEIEQEYLRMLDSEVPDLWNRIEAGLKTPEETRFAAFEQAQEQAANVISMETAAKKKTENKKRYAFWIGGIAAAAVVILLSVFLIGRFGREKKSNDSDTLDMTGELSTRRAQYSKEDSLVDGERDIDNPSINGGNAGAQENREEAREPEEYGKGVKPSYPSNAGKSESATEGSEGQKTTTVPVEEDANDDARSLFFLDEIPELGISLKVKEVKEDCLVISFSNQGEIANLKAVSAEIWYDSNGTWIPSIKDLSFRESDTSIKTGEVTELTIDTGDVLRRLLTTDHRIVIRLSDSVKAKKLVGAYDTLEIAASFNVK